MTHQTRTDNQIIKQRTSSQRARLMAHKSGIDLDNQNTVNNVSDEQPQTLLADREQEEVDIS